MEGVSEQIKQILDTEGLITEQFSGNELNENEGDKVIRYKELNGWGWAMS